MLKRTLRNNLHHFPTWRKIPKWLRGIIIFILTLIILIIALFGVVTWYVSANKNNLLTQIKELAYENLNNANLNIKDIDVVFWKTFPSVSIELKDVTLSDSLYHEHKHNLMAFNFVYANIKPLSILSKKPQLGRVIMSGGNIYMFKDSSDYSNLSIFKSDAPKKESGNNHMKISKFLINDVQFVFDNKMRNKKFDVTINKLHGTMETIDNIAHIHTDLDAMIGQLGFNLAKGGFLKNTTIEGHLQFTFNKTIKQLEIPDQKLKANGMPINFAAKFNMSPSNNNYTIVLNSEKLDFDKGRAMLSDHIAQKLSVVNVTKPIAFNATIDGYMRYPDTPKVVVNYFIKNNTIKLDVGNFKKANVTGRFTNNFIDGNGLGNPNSAIYIDQMKGEFEGVPVILDSSYIVDFLYPKLYCKLKTSFPVERLDDLAGTSFNLKKGKADLNIFYIGPLTQNDPTPKSLNGYINITNASMTYLPRNLKFDNCNAKIEFKDQDVLFKQVNLSSQNTNINLNGVGHKFLSAYFNDKYKASFDINISSPHINLDEFKSFLSPRNSSAKSSSSDNSVKFKKLNNQLDQALALSDMRLTLDVGKINYKKFSARNIHADVDLLASGLGLRNVRVQYANGQIGLNGRIDQNSRNNPFNVSVNIDKVNITELFKSFDNFGLDALTADNLKGIFSGDVNLVGGLDNDGNLLSRSLKGQVKFKLNEGALNNFGPLLQVQKFAFKGRNLSNVTFKELSNTLDIDQGKIRIHPMEIISSAIYLRVQGIFAIDKGTDIFIEAPLRNPKKDEALLAQGKEAKRTKGLVIYLRAKDDGTGKVKISWDPQKKGLTESELANTDEEDNDETEKPTDILAEQNKENTNKKNRKSKK